MTKRPLVEVAPGGISKKAVVDQGGDARFFTAREPKRRFLYNKETNEAYAEVVDGSAICLETGEQLFRFKDSEGDKEGGGSSGFTHGVRFDFTPPGGKRHPSERFVDVPNLVKAGILSGSDVASHRAFSDEELHAFMERLDAI